MAEIRKAAATDVTRLEEEDEEYFSHGHRTPGNSDTG
jgi:hypothetical protein